MLWQFNTMQWNMTTASSHLIWSTCYTCTKGSAQTFATDGDVAKEANIWTESDWISNAMQRNALQYVHLETGLETSLSISGLEVKNICLIFWIFSPSWDPLRSQVDLTCVKPAVVRSHWGCKRQYPSPVAWKHSIFEHSILNRGQPIFQWSLYTAFGSNTVHGCNLVCQG